MNVTPVLPAIPPGGIAGLAEVPLTADHQRLLDQAATVAAGPAVWRRRKMAEAHDVLALAQLSPRLQVMGLDLREALRVLLLLRVPVPCLPDPNGGLVVARQAVLGLAYPEEALRRQLPGFAFLQVLAPDHVWHANVSPVTRCLCLGTRLPAGVRVRELVLMAYGALSMQTVQIDELDPAGVMNPAAAYWWQRNTQRFPLTRASFLSAPGPDESEQR